MDIKHHFAHLRLKVESGYTITIQAVFYIALLFILLAFVFDFGSVGYMTSIATTAMRVAAQDAAKNIDVDLFTNEQEIRLGPNATSRAYEVASEVASGYHVAVLNVSVQSFNTRDVIYVQGHVDIDLPLLGSIFGIKQLIVPVEAYAEPAYGITQEEQ